MIFGNPVRARDVCFYFCTFYVLLLGCAGSGHDVSKTYDRKNLWQDFKGDVRTTHIEFSCEYPRQAVNRIVCQNDFIAILKVRRKAELHGEHRHMQEDAEHSIILLDECNGWHQCNENVTVRIQKQCEVKDTGSAFGVEYLCIEDSDIVDIHEDNLSMKTTHHTKDILYVKRHKTRSTSNCNFSVTSPERRSWSVFLFHVGIETDFDVYNGTQRALRIRNPEYGKPGEIPFPVVLIEQPMLGKMISFYFSGQIDFLIAIKDTRDITLQVNVTSNGYIAPTSSFAQSTTKHPSSTSTTQLSPSPTSQFPPATTATATTPIRGRPGGSDKRMKNVYIGVGAGVGSLLLMMIPLAVVILYCRKRRLREPRLQRTGELYSQPMKKKKQSANNSRGTGRKHTSKRQDHQSYQSKTSVHSDAPPPIPLFLGMEKTNGKDEEMYVNMTPTAPTNNPKVVSCKIIHKTPRSKRGNKHENH